MKPINRLIMVFFTLVLFSNQGLAFERTGFIWARLPVTYVIHTASSQEMGPATTIAAVQDSYGSWEAPNCTRYRSEFLGETNTSWRYQDGTNTLQWIYNPNQRPRELGGPATIGVTLSVFNQNGAVDGDILFNGIDHQWTTNAVRRGQVDAQSIITHETGHQLGLNHSPFQTATMYAAYLGGSSARTLEDDDVNGVCSLYPSGAAEQCQGDDDCPDNQRCLRGSCVAGAGGGDNPGVGGGTIGEPCGPSGECAAGHQCVQSPQGAVFCTRGCGDGCPAGWDCTNTNLGQLCVPGQGGGQPGGGFGDPCAGSAECASGFCISDGQNAFCSQGCSTVNDCPDGAQCVPTSNGGGACIPGQGGNGSGSGTAGAYGDACSDGSQCQSQVCVGDPNSNAGICSQTCTTPADCPDGSGCIPTQSGQSVCAPGQGTQGFGESCEGSNQCQSMLCIEGDSGGVCTQGCMTLDDCPAGSQDCIPTQSGTSVCLPGDPNANNGPMTPQQDPDAMSNQMPDESDSTETVPVPAGGTQAPVGDGQPAQPTGPAAGGTMANGEVFFEPEQSASGDSGGCACDATQSSDSPAWIYLLGLLIGLRFRRFRSRN